jgi:hypothetical protein
MRRCVDQAREYVDTGHGGSSVLRQCLVSRQEVEDGGRITYVGFASSEVLPTH